MKSCLHSCVTCGVVVILALIVLIVLVFHSTTGLFR
jgi:hypothetical protein